MKKVGFYDWKLNSSQPVSWINVHSSGDSASKTQDIHRALHLGLILSGIHVGRYGSEEIVLQKSEIYLTAPWEPHCTLPSPADRNILLINLDDITLEKFFFTGYEKLELLFVMPPQERMRCINQAPGRIYLLENAVKIQKMPDTPEKVLSMYNNVLAFFIGLLPYIRSRDPAGGLPGSRLRPALQDLGRKLMSVEEAARLCNLSSSRFAVLFKARYGISFARYERLFRLNGAKDDIQRGATLKEAAEKWSFCDKSHLARLLKKY